MAVSGTRYELREVDLRAKPAEMLAASAKATVPVLVLPDGEVIDESLDIMRWALRRRDPETWLEREDAALITVNDGPFKDDLDGYKYTDRHKGDPIAHRERALNFLYEIEDRLSNFGQLGGSVRGFTDAAIMPFVRQFAAVNREWFGSQPLHNLHSWLGAHLQSPLFKSIMMAPGVWAPVEPSKVHPAL